MVGTGVEGVEGVKGVDGVGGVEGTFLTVISPFGVRLEGEELQI